MNVVSLNIQVLLYILNNTENTFLAN